MNNVNKTNQDLNENYLDRCFGGVRLADGVLLERVGSDMMLMDVRSGLYYALNASGAEMLKLMLSGADQLHLIEVLGQKYDVSLPQLQKDLVGLVHELSQRCLVHAIWNDDRASNPANGVRAGLS